MRDKVYYQNKAKEIIKQIHYLTLATVSKDGTPWNSPLAYSHDSNLTFYFGSPKHTQHSQNIRNNGKGFVVIYDSTAPDGEGEGVYMTTKVVELENKEEISKAINVMFGDGAKYIPEQFMGDAELRVYKLVPEKVWMNDAEEKEGLFYDYRVKIDIKDL